MLSRFKLKDKLESNSDEAFSTTSTHKFSTFDPKVVKELEKAAKEGKIL